MKHEACLCARKIEKAVFTHVNLLQASLSVRKYQNGSFHHCGGPVKLVQACSRGRIDLQSTFHLCGGPVKLVQDCVCAGKT